MSSKRELKKEINFVYEELISAVYYKALSSAVDNEKKSEALIDKAIGSFDSLISKVNKRGVVDTKGHFKTIKEELNSFAVSFLEEIK